MREVPVIDFRSRASAKRLALVAILLLLSACQSGVPRPVAIEPEDMCAYCKMAISEKRFAAELIDREGQAFKFDDISCMTGFVKKREPSNIAARFVMDFDTKEWVKAEQAFYVKSGEIKSPMGGGMIAFASESEARDAADKYRGTLLRFSDVFAREE
jgi:copper chaperone NosL